MSVVAKRLDGLRCHLIWRFFSSQATLSSTGTHLPPKKWANGWMHQDATWYRGRPQPRGLCVRLGPSHPPPQQGGGVPQFSAHVYCGHTAAWIKMALGMKVGLGPGHIALDGDPAPLQEQSHAICGPISLWPNGWMHHGATWYGGKPQPRRLSVR